MHAPPNRFSLLACLLLLTSTSSIAEGGLTPHAAEYKVKISILSGKLHTQLRATDDGYLATHEVEPAGLANLLVGGHIIETSGFRTVPTGVIPVSYSSSDTMSKDKVEAQLAFDWSSGAVTGTVNGELVDDVLEDLAHDRVSIQYELMHDLQNGGLNDTYILFDIDRLKTLHVTNIGEKEVKVPAGTFTAIGIQHQAEGSSRATTLWCVEELGYLPVIVEQHRKGKLTMRASLRSYTPL